jgi:hypothetical protein
LPEEDSKARLQLVALVAGATASPICVSEHERLAAKQVMQGPVVVWSVEQSQSLLVLISLTIANLN